MEFIQWITLLFWKTWDKLICEQFAKVHTYEMKFRCPLEIYLHISNYLRDFCVADNAEMAKYHVSYTMK